MGVGHTKASPAEKLSSERETDEESKLSKTKFCKAVWRSPHPSFASQNPPSPLEKANLGVSFANRGGAFLNPLSRTTEGRPYEYGGSQMSR